MRRIAKNNKLCLDRYLDFCKKLYKTGILLAAAAAFAVIMMMPAAAAEGGTELLPYSEGYVKYVNYPYGYKIVLPSYLNLDEDMVSVKSRFYSENLVVEILYDNFEGTLDNKSTYNNYGNWGIKDNSEFKITDEFNRIFGGRSSHVVLYERRKVSGELDRNYYATIAVPRTNKEIITVFIKSAAPIFIDYIMPYFGLTEKSGVLKADRVFEPVEKNFDEQTQAFYDKYLGKDSKLKFGIFEPSYPMYPYILERLQKTFDYDFPVTLLYNTFELPFKKDVMANAKAMGKVVEYTLYTTDVVNGVNKDITLDILEGKYDTYLNNFADSINEYDYPLLLRISNEMNGGWVKYSSYHVGKDTDLYIACWRYIYDKLKDKGVDNLIYVWNPNELSFPNYAYNHYLSYYPGNEYVDVVGLTAYNTGNYYEGETWRLFTEAYDAFYYDYVNHFKHPMMITEFSSSSTGGNKPAWFDNMFSVIGKYDRIKLAVLWNGQDYDPSKSEKTVSRCYRLDENQAVIDSVKRGLQLHK